MPVVCNAYRNADPRNRGGRRVRFSAYQNSIDLARIKSVQARKIRVLVVDHNPLLREGLALLINLQPDMELAATAMQAREAVDLFRAHRPDVTIMDLDLPLGGGLEALKQIRKIDAKASIIGLVTYEGESSAGEALQAGACGFLAKDRLNEELVPLIRKCVR
jgi:DNA-binding NarL/FixJ family response regulator